MKYSIAVILCLFIVGCSSQPRRLPEQKFKTVFISEHPTKGSFAVEFGKPIQRLPAYDTDFEECTKQIYAKGVSMGGVTITDYETLKQYEEDAFAASRQAIAASLKGQKVKGDQSLYGEADRIKKERVQCMRDMGWTSREEKISIESTPQH